MSEEIKVQPGQAVRLSEHGMRLQEIPVDDLRPNPWNPNEMDDETFNRLAEELNPETGTGFIDPIQVVPMDDGSFQIIGGEHRWRVAKVLGFATVPAVVMDTSKWSDEDLRKFVTTRLNALRGNVNPEKFMKLYMDLASRHEAEALQALMGFTDEEVWSKLTKSVREGLKDAGLGKDALKKFDEATAELKTVDDLAGILNRIFTEHGDDLKHHFLVFAFGGKDHLYIEFHDAKRFKVVRTKVETIRGSDLHADEVVFCLLDGWAGPKPAVQSELPPEAQ